MRTFIGLFAFYIFCFPICYGKYGFDHDHHKFIKDSHQIDLHRRLPNRIVKHKNWKQFGVPQLPQLQSICFNICRPPSPPPPPPPQQEYAYGYEEEDPYDTTFDPGCFYRDLLIRRRQPYSIGRPQIHYYSRKIKDDKKRSGKQFYQQGFSQLKCSIICYPLTYNHQPPPYDRPIVPGPRPIRPTGHPPPNRPSPTNRPPRPAPPKRTTTEEAASATTPSTTTTTTSDTSNNVTVAPSNSTVNPNATTSSGDDDDDDDDDDDTTNNDTPVEVTMFPAPPTVSRTTKPPSNKASKVLKKQISRRHISSK